MFESTRFQEIVHLASFTRARKGWMDEEIVRTLEFDLSRNPDAGDVIAGTGGVRKVRIAVGARGKRGGARVIYYQRAANGRIYLITAYRKNEQANLTAAQRQAMRQLTARLDQET